ncbi:MAG: hypothetical protein ABJM29_19375 [Rhizobiaceae bacterium]
MSDHSASRGGSRIGLLVPFTNVNLESDMNLMRPGNVSFHVSRIGGYDVDEIPDAAQMAGLGASELDEPLSLLIGARPDLIMYGCTSATLTHGPEFDRALADRIHTMSGAKTVTAAGALVYAISAIGKKRIAFASPYTQDINRAAISFLNDSGIDVVSSAGIDEDLGNYGQGELTPDDVCQLGLRAVGNNAEALVLSCTEMRSVEAICRLESALDLPVITSNQAMLFQAMNLLSLPLDEVPFGRLFKQGGSHD